MRVLWQSSKVRLIIVGLLFSLSIAAISIHPWHSTAIQSTGQEEFFASLRDGLGSAIHFAGPASSSTEIRTSVDSTSALIYSRSGVQLSENIKTRITTMESAVLNGTRRRIKYGELKDILTNNLLQRVNTLTDAQIDYISGSLRTLPDWHRSSDSNFVMLRSSRVDGLSPEEFAKNAKAFRDSQGPQAEEWRKLAGVYVEEDLKGRLEALSAAIPEQWGGVLSNGLTPLQAFILSYSSISDDFLADSINNLRSYMVRIQSAMTSTYGSYPSPEGKFAYGVNGYLYSTPLDLLFNEGVMGGILNSIEERYVP